jgi:hypothetical protein
MGRLIQNLGGVATGFKLRYRLRDEEEFQVRTYPLVVGGWVLALQQKPMD